MSLERFKKNPFLRIVFAPYIQVKRFFIRRGYEKFYRQYDEMMTLVRSESLAIELVDFCGIFDVGKESLLAKYILKEGAFEPDLAALTKQYLDPSKDVVDVGANVGFFTVLFGKTIDSNRRVLAAEPTPGALKRLKRNIERNEVKNVTIHEGLVGSVEATVPFHVVPGKEEYSSMKPIAHEHALGFETSKMDLPCLTLDKLVSEHSLEPGFLKIDVEGAEWEVFQGAESTIRKFHPVILTELDDRLLKGFNSSSSQVCRFLEGLNYNLRDADGLGPVRPGLTTSVMALPK